MSDRRTMRKFLDLINERDEALAEATRLADLLDGLTRAGLTDDQLDVLFDVLRRGGVVSVSSGRRR